MSEVTTTPGSFVLKGWHVLLIVIAFFLSVFTIDGLMMYKAYSSFPGEVAAKPFEEGVAFNGDLRRRAAARALGWTASLTDKVIDGRARLVMVIRDRDRRPVAGLAPKATLTRTVTTQGETMVAFVETSPGVYEASTPARAGLWDLNVKAPTPGQGTFELEQRLVWP